MCICAHVSSTDTYIRVSHGAVSRYCDQNKHAAVLGQQILIYLGQQLS